MDTMIGIIGGSGLYDIDGLEDAKWVSVETPWGAPSDQIMTGVLDGLKMAFLPRHGRGHVHSPSTVPYRANIDALKRIGVTDIISLSATGSFREKWLPVISSSWTSTSTAPVAATNPSSAQVASPT